MYHAPISPAFTAAGGAIRAVAHTAAARILELLQPLDRTLETALDKTYGRGNWFVYWDEDLGGRPIRGTVTLAYGSQTLVIG